MRVIGAPDDADPDSSASSDNTAAEDEEEAGA
jgi:hypothetical protein